MGNIFFSLLQVLLIALKFLGVITWGWVWVLAPIWIGLGFAIVATGLFTFIVTKVKK